MGRGPEASGSAPGRRGVCESGLKGGTALSVCVAKREAADAAVRGNERGTDSARL